MKVFLNPTELSLEGLDLGATLGQQSLGSLIHHGAVDDAIVPLGRKLEDGPTALRAARYRLRKIRGNALHSRILTLSVDNVDIMHTDMTIQGLCCKDVTAGEDHYRGRVNVDFSVRLKLNVIDDRVLLIPTFVATKLTTVFTTDTWAAMAALEGLGTALVAWKSFAGRCAWHGACTLVLAVPDTGLDAWSAWLTAFTSTRRVRTADLMFSVSLRRL